MVIMNMVADQLKTSKANMSAFLDHLNSMRQTARATAALKQSRTYRLNALQRKVSEGARAAAEKVFMSIYTNAVPVDKQHRIVYETSLQKTMQRHIEESGEPDVYDYLKKAAKQGSAPAKMICENADKYISESCRKYYLEEDTDIDDVDISADINDAVVKITSDMDVDAVSEAIENNVRATIASEMAISKQEDEKLAALQQRLADDEGITEEGHIEGVLIGEGYCGFGRVYTPQLFTGIMMGKVKMYTEEGELDGPDIQKKAYYESVKELTALQTLHTLGCITIDHNNVAAYTRKYMAG